MSGGIGPTNSVSDQDIIDAIEESAKDAGYDGLQTAHKLHKLAPGFLKFVKARFGNPTHCWGTRLAPGGFIGKHAHNGGTFVYFLHDHPNPLWIKEEGEKVALPCQRGDWAFFEQGVEHWVDVNETDDVRYTLVITTERKR